MIKLNNKNITYVALADSSNSLKAPKEIWYADSPNSVKLVYRRKDALIEGVDYEKYHWLRAEVNTRATMCILPTDSNVIEFKSKRIRGRNFHYFYTNGNYVYFCAYGLQKAIYNYNTSAVIYYSSLVALDEEVIISCNDNKIMVGNDEFPIYGYPIIRVQIQAADSEGMETLTSSITVDGIEHYIPCKLLKPVPKWLDANGIRRQVGECGMIDLVSGKFYGNVNSVGTFTVENYYERKEWLKGDGSAYMQISQTSRTDFNINLTYKLSNVYKQMLYGSFYSTSGGWKGNMLTWGETNGIADKILLRISTSDGNNYRYLGAQDVDVVHTIKVVDGRCYFDDVDKGVCPGYSIYNYDKPFLLFNGYNVNTITESNASNASISKFSIEGYCNLIPCTLTMDLPASMDANNIARTKGTSGMWDLVSDRFYGNVANSGTFKAVNLAEGVDYEVHQWLKTGSGNPYIQVDDTCNTDANAYIETTYKCNYSNGGFDMAVGFSVNQNNNIGIRIFNTANGTFVDYHKTENGVLSSYRVFKTQSSINAERYIKATLDNLIIDTTEYPTINWGSGFDSVNYPNTRLLTNSDNNDVRFKRTKIRVNFKELDLVPVKLLRSIPAKYDANGIARNAGECGMYDTVNDVFYGNVASSGTFSVSDNE